MYNIAIERRGRDQFAVHSFRRSVTISNDPLSTLSRLLIFFSSLYICPSTRLSGETAPNSSQVPAIIMDHVAANSASLRGRVAVLLVVAKRVSICLTQRDWWRTEGKSAFGKFGLPSLRWVSHAVHFAVQHAKPFYIVALGVPTSRMSVENQSRIIQRRRRGGRGGGDRSRL